MGAYGGTEIAELVGLIALKSIEEQLPYLNFGLYRDDRLAVYESGRGARTDRRRKSLKKIFLLTYLFLLVKRVRILAGGVHPYLLLSPQQGLSKGVKANGLH